MGTQKVNACVSCRLTEASCPWERALGGVLIRTFLMHRHSMRTASLNARLSDMAVNSR
jgi:hypothetical protein